MKSLADVGCADLDEVRLRKMLDLVGPASETRLLQSLLGDLAEARAALALALAAGDGHAICAQTHVLAALAGTFGAPLLAAAAQLLDQQSKSTPTSADGTEVLAMTDRLTVYLSERLAVRPARRLS